MMCTIHLHGNVFAKDGVFGGDWNLVLVADANMKLDVAKKNSILVFIKFKCKKLYTYYITYKLFICL